MVLVEPLDEGVVVVGSMVSPGAALGVGANGDVLLLPLLPFLVLVLIPGVPPVGLVVSKLENVPSKALLSETCLALGGHLAQPVGVSTPVVDCYKANRHGAAADPLGRHSLRELDLEGTAAKGPGAPVMHLAALGTCGPGVVVGRTAEGVATMDAAPPT